MAGRSILITGVSSGIGYALADEALRRDWQVWGLSRRIPRDLVERGLKHEAVDLSDLAGLRAIQSRFLGEVREWELVVLNAGTLGTFGDLTQVGWEDLQRVWETNVLANKVLLDGIVEAGVILRQVVALSSGAAHDPKLGIPAYCVSKAALTMLIRLYALELVNSHFCLLMPGIVDTAMQRELSSRSLDERYPLLRELKIRREAGQLSAPPWLASQLLERYRELPDRIASGEALHIASLS